MAKTVIASITETFHDRVEVEIPDGIDDIEGYIEELCNSGEIDITTNSGINFSRHIDYDDEED